MQAQDYASALWAVGLRSPGSTRATIEQAVADRLIVRTWPMRGTLHFIAPTEVRWMLALLGPRVIAKSASQKRILGLDDNGVTIGRSADALTRALTGNQQLKRAELMAVLEQAGIATTGQRGYHLLWHAALAGLICLGPMQDKQQTFVLLDEWLPPSKPLTREESLARLTRQYYTGHGPATQQDLMWWAGLTATDVKLGLELVKSELSKETIQGQTHWLGSDAVPLPKRDASVQLLPGFDEYLLGYRDRGTILAPEHTSQVCPGGNGIFAPMIVVDGQIVGTWKRTVKKTTATIELLPFTTLTATTRAALQKVADRFGTFWSLTAVLAPA